MHDKLNRGTLLCLAWPCIRSKEARWVPNVGLLKKFCLPIGWEMNRFDSDDHCGRKKRMRG